MAEGLHKESIRLLRHLRQVDERTGLSPARLSVLSILVFAGPGSPGDLARAEQVKPPTMTRLLQGLAEDGLVVLIPDPGDGRGKRVKATDKGRRLMKKAREARLEPLMADLGSLEAHEFRALNQAVDILKSILMEK